MTTLQRQIRDLRVKRGLTQEQLAQKVDVDTSAVCQWETGRTSPRSDKVPKIAKALKVTVAALYGEAA